MRVPHRWTRRWRRGRVLVVTLIVFPLLGLFGLIGSGQTRFRGERFVSKLVVVRPAGDDGVRITEHIDVDFGPNRRHGYERTVPHDFGIPTEITATSTANANVNVESTYGEQDQGIPETVRRESGYRRREFGETQIRVGSPDETFGGTQRYTLSYTLPNAELSTGALRLDIVGTDETLTTDRFEVVLDGFTLTNPTCSTGPDEIFGGCGLSRRDDGTYRAIIEPLEPGNGVTIGGDDIATSGSTRVGASAAAPPTRMPGWQVALILVGVEVAVLCVLFAVASLLGANRVASGGATAAAFVQSDTNRAKPRPGWLGKNSDDDSDADDRIESHRVSDIKLEDLATVEFVPPAGIRPWHGAVLLNEVIDGRSVGAWLAEMVALGAIKVDGSRLEVAPDLSVFTLEDDDREWLDALFSRRSSFDPLLVSSTAAQVWNKIARRQESEIRKSQWWLKRPPTMREKSHSNGLNWSMVSFAGVIVVILMAIFHQAIGPIAYGLAMVWSFLTAPLWSAVGITAIGVAYAAWRVLTALLPVRSVAGSAATLRVMSFRNFLTGSEGTRVDAAWDRSRIREYSGWAVALGAADAWARAVGDLEPTKIAAPGVSSDVFTTMIDSFADVIDSVSLQDLSVNRFRYQSSRSDPWGSLFEAISKADWGSGSGGSSSRSSGGSSTRSSSVGGGGGGGRSGTW